MHGNHIRNSGVSPALKASQPAVLKDSCILSLEEKKICSTKSRKGTAGTALQVKQRGNFCSVIVILLSTILCASLLGPL